MKPTDFSESNIVFAKDQPQYLPLPADITDDGIAITCWTLTWRERLIILFTGRIWLKQMTFNKPLQPQLLSVECPFVE